MKIIKKRNMKSTIVFKKEVAKSFHKIEYYISMGEFINTVDFRKREKQRLRTSIKLKTELLIDQYKKKGQKEIKKVSVILKNIFMKNNKAAVLKQPPPTVSDLHNLVCNPSILLHSYSMIKANKGATTIAYILSYERLKKLNPAQRRFVSNTINMPDGISLTIIEEACKLLKKGIYPWGASRRIYIDKPGTDKKRPITIPPFMDRIIQHAIKTILESVYEPFFEYQNSSFGFRTHRGCHDAIYKLIRPESEGMNIAIEGDVKGAYDNVSKSKLIEILEKRIVDKKFINLIKQRLDYQFYDSDKQKFIEEKDGIPQGGIDSPYLWNIYFHEFDVWVDNYLNDLKLRTIFPKTKHNVSSKHLFNLKRSITTSLSKYNRSRIRPIPRQEIYDRIKKVRLLNHKIRNIDTIDPNKKPYKFTYCRYADDWIVLICGSKLLAEKIKKDIKNWLIENLHANLSMEKTLVTDLKERRSSAHFLGFEFQVPIHNKLLYVRRGINLGVKKSLPFIGKRITGYKWVLSKVAGTEISSLPDRQRLLNRFHMKSYCDKYGFPIKVGWLTSLEPHIIIERYNSVIRGLVNYYNGFITRNSYLNRWVYILRYSCYKTLACKYRTTISKLFKKYGIGYGKNRTIAIRAIISSEGKRYSKEWILLTEEFALSSSKLYDNIRNRFIFFENNKNPLDLYKYNPNNKPTVKDLDFLERFNWVNVRTQANLDFPCSMCGKVGATEMHHINHVRKNKYSLLNSNWEQVMSLRNRRQIPVCKACHLKIHSGARTSGLRLTNLKMQPIIYTNPTLYDNKITSLENYIKKGSSFEGKSLEDKGWKEL